jgi:hypothetical protein
MCAVPLGAHDDAMFTSYEMTRAFVAERQETLRHEARQHHLGRGRRRDRGAGRPAVQGVRPAPPRPAPAPITDCTEAPRAA